MWELTQLGHQCSNKPIQPPAQMRFSALRGQCYHPSLLLLLDSPCCDLTLMKMMVEQRVPVDLSASFGEWPP